MSRIGRVPHPRARPASTSTIAGRHVTVKGPKGTLDARPSPARSPSARRATRCCVERPDDERQNRALHGLTRSLVNNMVVGVTDGFRKELEIVGVGYRATAQGPTKLELALGFSHPVQVEAPDGITFEVPAPTTHRRAAASTRSWSARWPPTSERSASPSPTRARACATAASTCRARPARPAK